MDFTSEISIQMLDAELAKLKRYYGAATMSKLSAFVDNLTQRELLTPIDPRQRHGRASPFWLPELLATPWHETQHYTWIKKLEMAYPEILVELNISALLEHEHEQREFKNFDIPPGMIDETVGVSKGWVNVSFLRSGFNNQNVFFERYDANIKRFPVLCNAIEDLPLATESRISILRPDGAINPHCSTFNGQLVVHLGLIIPKGCAIKVAGDTRNWLPGKCLMFDDTFEHEVWNKGTESRIVLLLSVWHPQLSLEEIEGLKRLFNTLFRISRL